MLTPAEIVKKSNASSSKSREQALKSLCVREGFNAEGKMYILAVETPEFRSKMSYCPYATRTGYFGWHSSEPVPGLPMFSISATDVVVWDEKWNCYKVDPIKTKLVIAKGVRPFLEKDELGSEFVGKIGERRNFTATIYKTKVLPSKSDFGDLVAIFMKDENKNTLLWCQRNFDENTISSFIKATKGKPCDVRGTIVTHRTDKGRAYTKLSRCEITCGSICLDSFSHRHQEKKMSK